MSLSDKDYQKKLDVQIAYWDKLKNEIQKVRSGENGTADLVDMSETYFQMADETVAAVKVSNANRQLEQKPTSTFTRDCRTRASAKSCSTMWNSSKLLLPVSSLT